MGYSRKSLQILGGSFNMLPPVDKTPQTDYLLAQNWRVDSLGRLVSRAGYVSKFSIAGAGIAHSASNTGGVSSAYYVGCNSGLVAPTSALYYNGNSSAIATGFDGNRMAFAAQNNFTWVMNRGKQGRHSGSGAFETWNLTPPPASATVATGASPGPSASATYNYVSQGDPLYNHFLTIAGVTYSFLENGYSNAQIPLVIASLASGDPNCTVTFPGTGNNVVITPIVVNTLIPISGSDGNAVANLANGAVSSLPNGTYQFYLTFESKDETLESNPGPVSLPVVAASQAIVVTIPAADAPADSRIGFVNIYAVGGTLGKAYRVGRVSSTVASPATTFTDTIPDLDATNNGIVMPTNNDPAPAASGMIGPHFSRLYAWSTAAAVNRLFYTDPGVPQYWPGAQDDQVGNWVDVGLDGEAIVWCTIHTNLLVIYKERSIWMLLNDPSGQTAGSLQQVHDGIGLAGQWALTPAGLIDYFVGPNGLYLFDMDKAHEIAGAVLPVFNQSVTNAGALTPPGSILPGSAFNSTSLFSYSVALGHALGKLYISYAEAGSSSYNLLVYAEGPEPELGTLIKAAPGKWFYHRNAIAGTLGGFFGFFFDGVSMIGLTGAAGGAAQGFNVDDFRGFLTTDPGGKPIECVYQSHYEDCGLPDNDKMWLEVRIDFEFSGTTANVYAGFNNGTTPLTLIGTLSAGARTTVSFGFPGSVDGGILARNISVAVDASASGVAILHNVYLYYYVEARLALVASTIPTDLGIGKVKECKELQLDIDASLGAVSVAIQSDLPGNTLATRQTPSVAKAGRAILKYPFATTLGLLWQVVLVGGPFRLYGARLLMRVLGVFVEGYESAAGFVWDSMQTDLGNGDDKSFDQLRFDMHADGAAAVTILTDLPGEAFVSRGTFILTAGPAQRAWVTVPLPDGIEGRSLRLQVTGNAGYRLYKVQARYARVGRYLAGSTPSGNNDAFSTLEFDFASERLKTYKRLELDMRADGTVNLSVITNQDGDKLTEIYTPALVTPYGRQTLMVPMPPGVRGRLLRLKLTGTAAARIYRIRVWTRPVNEPGAGWKWEEFPLESSDIVPTWADLIVEETPPVWQWVDLPFEVTGE